ncbi:sensor histidine kinase [Solidesulfovibrio magneticus]|uniref:histidine kinase n=1 Tax=Solidesulfovibrio magneticus (strain ATCC 700980 / DSM 13731 / RS-1) TaxID=573370 RepID=C4XKR6_SOLM1|nr:sensor histidine kinase [Solidesulfovibrio magneticus]BAH74455.1 putative sensor histidine kinase [Solidesulfovibrio magneticus RS-1]
MRYVLHGLIASLLVVASFFVLFSAYNDIKTQAVENLNTQQRILAKSAAKGIESYFATKKDLLQLMGSMPEVIDMNEEGKRILKNFFQQYTNEYHAISRVDERGEIIYSYPDEDQVGSDISSQQHVQKILSSHEPVLSSVFKSNQGLDVIALHVPVFEAERFVGSVAVLLPFDRIAKDFVSDIKIGKSGYALLLSQEGVELYCPFPGHVGEQISNTGEEYPSILAMASRMLKGEEGTAAYDFGMDKDENFKNLTKYAVFLPVKLDQTFWSISVVTPEREALDYIEGLRTHWIMALVLLFTASAYCGFLIVRAYFVVRKKTFELSDAAKELSEANVRLQEVDKIKSVFIESVSHELRTPMTSIMGFIKLISKDFWKNFKPFLDQNEKLKKKTERIMENLQIVEFEGERLTRLINDVLDSAKIESGRMKWDDQIFQINDVLWLAVSTIKGQLPIGVDVLYSNDNSSPWVKADPDRLMQVMMNLLSNAVKFTSNGYVSVSYESSLSNILTVTVKDTGVGIPDGDLEKVFDRFHQVQQDNDNESKPKGTGLGLSICKQVVDHYGGKIWVESELGKGSFFKFTFPQYIPEG